MSTSRIWQTTTRNTGKLTGVSNFRLPLVIETAGHARCLRYLINPQSKPTITKAALWSTCPSGLLGNGQHREEFRSDYPVKNGRINSYSRCWHDSDYRQSYETPSNLNQA